ncbi:MULTISPECIES: metallophosphoesterase [unclassified Lentimonas]|uniref:metallophosphoesterase n=1 Tax=unclassified Lentimonas TaxID=2630993 RepID=UPI0013248C2E|nr:Unannotated [Lentimonas sp. CC19]CAA6690985.1 Unannotated [Lentimonas sp. CC10]CAA7070684.1 Unannotated [Lentimonas sp. CC11]
MKILVIPDIHEDLVFLAKIESKEDFDSYDYIVCLGDYFDPRSVISPTDEKLKATAIKIRDLKFRYADKLYLLCGNHDLPYYALRPDCIDCSDKANYRIGFSMRCTTIERAKAIKIPPNCERRRINGPIRAV